MFKIETLKVKGSVADFLDEMEQILEMKYLGSGVNGRAYKIDNDEIIKVFYRDDAYRYYIKKLSKLKEQNSFAPCINYVLKLKGTYETAYMVSMERLIEVTELKSKKERNEFYNFQNLIQDYVEDRLGFPKKIIDPIFPKELTDIVEIIETGTKRYLFANDLHAGNVMIRTNGQYVITDPMVGDLD